MRACGANGNPSKLTNGCVYLFFGSSGPGVSGCVGRGRVADKVHRLPWVGGLLVAKCVRARLYYIS